MKTNEKSTIYWTFDDIKDDFNIESNERVIVRDLSRASQIEMSFN